MTTILLVRHGETVDNARQIMQGQTQGELNEQGREQALKVAERLSSEPIDAVVASDLHRAIQTAEYIAMPHGLPVTTTKLLRERDWGSFTGRFIPDLRGEVWPDDIESENTLLERARSFLIYITTTYPDKRVVAVGHGIINKAILAVYAQCPMREVQRMMNAEVRVLSTSAVMVATTTTAACTASTAVTTASTSVEATTAMATASAPAEATTAVGGFSSTSSETTTAVASAE
jgi:probable phosphoglycerate mutase